MARRSPETAVKRAREQALREKRELKQAKKDARIAARQNGTDEPGAEPELDPAGEAEPEAPAGD